MKRLYVLFIALSLMLAGCAKDTVPQAPNTMPPSVMIDGIIYQSTGKQLPGEADPSAISGSIAEILPGNQLPSKDLQSNCGEVGMSYAFTEDGLVVLLANEWTLFEPMEQPQ